MQRTYSIQITGLVQGVGFRPFIFRLAKEFGILGTVENTTWGVMIRAKGEERKIRDFRESILRRLPSAAHIDSIRMKPASPGKWKDFSIKKSSDFSEEITEISPDIAVCEDCLRDMEIHSNRIHYPFVNCTNCGPRFTIVRELPYDRPGTAMSVFPMCPDCEREYNDIRDRRFHAQPVACLNCGPDYELHAGRGVIRGTGRIIRRMEKMILEGKILAVKGLGGFHLACNAFDPKAVKRLRRIKNREGKPFAVMYSSLESLEEDTRIGPVEKQSLLSWRRPIVLLANRRGSSPDEPVGRGLQTTCAMLPYLPFHHLFFRSGRIRAVVLTSGNLSDEPILTGNREAREKVGNKVDGILDYNRDIINRTDDSVVRIIGGRERVLRRSRGFAPSPVRVALPVEGILATGAELTNCFCIGKGDMAILSQHIGDVKNVETADFYAEALDRFRNLFRLKPDMVVSDLHPSYFTTSFGRDLSRREKIPFLQVQHHHAHIASCMAENGLDEKVIGIAMDGTGFGDDGHIWGAEFLLCDLAGYRRETHFEYIPLPGGDRSIEEPWRMGISYLYRAFGKEFSALRLPFLKSLKKRETEMILKMIDHRINSPMVSSAGRLFDAVAAILGICNKASFHAEGPMRLESHIWNGEMKTYPVEINEGISFAPAIREIVNDIRKKVPAGRISARFHNTVNSVIFETVKQMSKKYRIRKVVLSGGTFQNKYLLERAENELANSGYKVYSHCRIPPNDGGIALGQLAIAAKRRQMKCV